MKNAKKLFGILFAIIALALVMSLSIFAEETTPTVYEASTLSEYNTAYGKAVAGDTIKLTANITSSNIIKIEKAITLDLGGFTLTTTNGWGGLQMKNGCSLVNGTLNHSGRVSAIKAWNVGRFEDLVIECSYDGSGGPKTITGIAIQEATTVRVDLIKNVTIKGRGLTNGIDTYNCGNATQDVIGSMENVTIDARNYGMWIYAPIGTVKDCTISGDVAGVYIWAKGVSYTTTATFENCSIEGASQAMVIDGNITGNGGTIEVSADKNTTYESESDTTILVKDINPDKITCNIVGLTKDSNDVYTDCVHANLSVQGSCTVKAECADCTRVLGYVHNYQETDRVASSCAIAGYVVYECSCGATDTNKLPYDETAHQWSTAVTDPTCTEGGYTTYTCQINICGKTKTDNLVDALGHDMVTDAEAVPSTCTETGLTKAEHCSRCDDVTTTQKDVPELGHDMVTDAAVPSTCLGTGLTEGEHCSRCDDATVAQEEVDALGHDIVKKAAVAATCTDKGLSEGQYCTRCEDVTVTQKRVDALGHDIVTDKAAVAATCTATGLTEGLRCSRCDKATVAQQVVAALGHSWVDATTEAPKTCSVCAVTEGDKLPAPIEDPATDDGLSGGAIAAIVIGSVVVVGAGGFALFWFVIRKRFI